MVRYFDDAGHAGREIRTGINFMELVGEPGGVDQETAIGR